MTELSWIAWMDRNKSLPPHWNDEIGLLQRAMDNPAAYYSRLHLAPARGGRAACGRVLPEDDADNVTWAGDERIPKCKRCLASPDGLKWIERKNAEELEKLRQFNRRLGKMAGDFLRRKLG